MSDTPKPRLSSSVPPAKADPEVAQWLHRLGFDYYAPIFGENAITPTVLARLTDNDLKELGVKLLGHRKVMLYEIGKIGTPTSKIGRPPAPPSAAIPLSRAFPKASARVSPPPTASIRPARPQSAPIGVPPGAKPPVVKTPPPSESTAPRKRSYTAHFGGGFLAISILVHVFFGLAATYIVVQTMSQRKLVFQGGPPSPNPSQRSLEHKVQMAKKRNTMSAPVQSKRVVSVGLSKVSLPSMPAMPNVPNEAPTKMAGMGGAGVGFGPATGGMGNSGGSGGGSGLTVFGMRDNKSNGLTGQFYDLKRNRNRQESHMTPDEYSQEVAKFVKNGWHESYLEKYLKGFRKLYATQIFFTRIDSHEGHKAFGSDYAEPPGMWVALYKGQVSPPESGVYHFVAAGDDVMYVKFNGRLILDQCLDGNKTGVNPLECYKYPTFTYVNNGFAKSLPVTVTAGEYYDIEVLIGDRIPLDVWAFLFIEKNGVNYKKDKDGAPILPVFRLSGDKPRNAHPSGGTASPPYQEDGPVWIGRSIAPKPTP